MSKLALGTVSTRPFLLPTATKLCLVETQLPVVGARTILPSAGGATRTVKTTVHLRWDNSIRTTVLRLQSRHDLGILSGHMYLVHRNWLGYKSHRRRRGRPCLVGTCPGRKVACLPPIKGSCDGSRSAEGSEAECDGARLGRCYAVAGL